MLFFAMILWAQTTSASDWSGKLETVRQVPAITATYRKIRFEKQVAASLSIVWFLTGTRCGPVLSHKEQLAPLTGFRYGPSLKKTALLWPSTVVFSTENTVLSA